MYKSRNLRMNKGKFSKMLVTKELHKQFKKDFPEYKDMTWDEFFSLWLDIAKTIREEAITNPLGVRLGGYSGEIKLQYLPYKLKSDKPFMLSNGQPKPVNLLTKGKIPIVKWERKWAARFNKVLQLYAFEETREIAKLARDYVLNHPEKIRTSKAIPKLKYDN